MRREPIRMGEEESTGCCGNGADDVSEKDSSCCQPKRKIDWLLWGSLALAAAGYFGHLLAHDALQGVRFAGAFAHGCFELLNKMWWGLLLGMFFVGVLSKVPRDFVMGVLGKGGSLGGLLRATGAGLALDLCSHGILLVGMKLYERGASLGQVMAFLIASPWNSLSLTIILVSLIGLPWTLAFVLLSAAVAILTGLVFESLARRGVLPPNPNSRDLPENFSLFKDGRAALRRTRFDGSFSRDLAIAGFVESKMILRWIFFGTVMAAALRAAFTPDQFESWFGPTLAGLGLTLVTTTIIEVCSEGSSPIAADLLTRAAAPGNGFTFLMAGVATDYTEILSIRERTRSWKVALFLPLVTVPQVIVVGFILNRFFGG